MEMETNILNMPDEIIFQILKYLDSDPQAAGFFSLTCKWFHSLVCNSIKHLKPIDTEFFISTAVHKYPVISWVDFRNCPRIDDDILTRVANAYSETLESVDLSNSRFFTHVGLSTLATRTDLIGLDLSNAMDLNDAGAAAIAEATNLKTLWITMCDLVSDIGIRSIAEGCKKLKALCLRSCRGFTDLGVASITKNCPELLKLDLSHSRITGNCLTTVLQLPNLLELNLAECSGINDANLLGLRQGSNSLEVLDLSWCEEITHFGMISLINEATSLRCLSLANCSSVNIVLALSCFRKLTKLQEIKLDCTIVSTSVMIAIVQYCESLQSLSLRGCFGLMDDELSYLARRLRDLIKLDITGCEHLRHPFINALTLSCPNLTFLKMKENWDIAGAAFNMIGERCRSLVVVHFAETSITDEGLESISRNCSYLRYVNVRLCRHITDLGLYHMGRHCRNLTEVSVFGCSAISDTGIEALANGCPLLETINMGYCGKISDRSIIALTSYCVRLKKIDIRGCKAISSYGITAIAIRCKRLSVLDIKKSTIGDTGLLSLGDHSHNLRQINMSYCPVTDKGLRALANIRRLQNLHILHVSGLTPNGIADALIAGRGLKKVVLHISYRSLIPLAKLNEIRDGGCIIVWSEKENIYQAFQQSGVGSW